MSADSIESLDLFKNDYADAFIASALAADGDINAKGLRGYTALMMATERDDIQSLKYLLEKSADINRVDDQGRTALMIAAVNNRLEPVRLLIEWGADIAIQNKYYKTAFDLMVSSNRSAMVNLLSKTNGYHYAKASDTERLFLESVNSGKPRKTKKFIEEGINVNAVDAYGESALLIATRGGHYKCIDILLNHGAQVNATNGANQNALFFLQQGDKTKIMDRLIKAGIKFNQQDIAGRTPLMDSVLHNAIPCVQQLVQLGADVTLKDNQGRTALNIARDKYTEFITPDPRWVWGKSTEIENNIKHVIDILEAANDKNKLMSIIGHADENHTLSQF